jgi:hypothetical protein
LANSPESRWEFVVQILFSFNHGVPNSS